MDGLLRPTLGEHIAIELIRDRDPWTALVDPAQLEGAVLNLAINARDAMPEGGRLTIETGNVRLEPDDVDPALGIEPGQYVLIALSDTGSGIAPEHLERVFDPFFTTKEVGRGTGLGLSMVHGFVNQSGGHVRIYSEVGYGTTVRLYLPRATGEIGSEPSRPGGAFDGGSEVIVLVEDDELVRRFATGALTSMGYRVLVAPDSTVALDIIGGHEEIDLLFTDVIMPGGMNGRQLADAARALRPDLCVLFMSGYTEDAMVHGGRLDVGVRLLSKPFGRADLARAVRAALDGTVSEPRDKAGSEPAAERTPGD